MKVSRKLIDDVAVIIPAYNEDESLPKVCASLLEHFLKIYVVDDGSKNILSHTIAGLNIVCIRHSVNLGQGAAIQTGLEVALKDNQIKYFLTFDADGQHSIGSALEFVNEIKNSDVDIILGSRFLKSDSINMPIKKKLILRLAIMFTRIDSGLDVTDTHNGLRIMSRDFAEKLRIKHAGMAHASEILNHIKQSSTKWKESPAQIFYTEYSIRKGQSILNAINILTEMIFK